MHMEVMQPCSSNHHLTPYLVPPSLLSPSQMEERFRELQLLPMPSSTSSSPYWISDSSPSSRSKSVEHFDKPSLDLKLSISLQPFRPLPDCFLAGSNGQCSEQEIDLSFVKSLKWQVAEQIKLAAAEKAYAERVREMTKREMELAQSEFAKARLLWERAREEMEKAERLKETATKQIDSTSKEITCYTCKHRFHA